MLVPIARHLFLPTKRSVVRCLDSMRKSTATRSEWLTMTDFYKCCLRAKIKAFCLHGHTPSRRNPYGAIPSCSSHPYGARGDFLKSVFNNQTQLVTVPKKTAPIITGAAFGGFRGKNLNTFIRLSLFFERKPVIVVH